MQRPIYDGNSILPDQVCNFLLLSDSYTILYAIGAAIGSVIALPFHAEPLTGAALGCCVVSFVLNALDLWARLIVWQARRSE